MNLVEILLSFIVSLLAGIIANLICRWFFDQLDKEK